MTPVSVAKTQPEPWKALKMSSGWANVWGLRGVSVSWFLNPHPPPSPFVMISEAFSVLPASNRRRQDAGGAENPVDVFHFGVSWIELAHRCNSQLRISTSGVPSIEWAHKCGLTAVSSYLTSGSANFKHFANDCICRCHTVAGYRAVCPPHLVVNVVCVLALESRDARTGVAGVRLAPHELPCNTVTSLIHILCNSF
jgi:hypothetical protein